MDFALPPKRGDPCNESRRRRTLSRGQSGFVSRSCCHLSCTDFLCHKVCKLFSAPCLENPKYFHTADVLFFLGTNSSTTTGFSSPCIVVVRCCALYIVVCLLLSVSSLPKRKGVETLAACVGKTPDL